MGQVAYVFVIKEITYMRKLHNRYPNDHNAILIFLYEHQDILYIKDFCAISIELYNFLYCQSALFSHCNLLNRKELHLLKSLLNLYPLFTDQTPCTIQISTLNFKKIKAN